MAKQTDPVIEAIAQSVERRMDALTAPTTARRQDLRAALNAATGDNKKR